MDQTTFYVVESIAEGKRTPLAIADTREDAKELMTKISDSVASTLGNGAQFTRCAKAEAVTPGWYIVEGDAGCSVVHVVESYTRGMTLMSYRTVTHRVVCEFVVEERALIGAVSTKTFERWRKLRDEALEEITRMQGEATDHADELKRAYAYASSLYDKLKSASGRLADAESTLQSEAQRYVEKLQGYEREMTTATSTINRLTASLSSYQGELASLRVDRQRIADSLTEATNENARVRLQNMTLGVDLEALREELNVASKYHVEYECLKVDLKSLSDELESMRAVHERDSAMLARCTELEELVEKYSEDHGYLVEALADSRDEVESEKRAHESTTAKFLEEVRELRTLYNTCLEDLTNVRLELAETRDFHEAQTRQYETAIRNLAADCADARRRTIPPPPPPPPLPHPSTLPSPPVLRKPIASITKASANYGNVVEELKKNLENRSQRVPDSPPKTASVSSGVTGFSNLEGTVAATQRDATCGVSRVHGDAVLGVQPASWVGAECPYRRVPGVDIPPVAKQPLRTPEPAFVYSPAVNAVSFRGSAPMPGNNTVLRSTAHTTLLPPPWIPVRSGESIVPADGWTNWESVPARSEHPVEGFSFHRVDCDGDFSEFSDSDSDFSDGDFNMV